MADTHRPQNVLIGAFVTLLCALFFLWLLVKLVFFLICLRYKCKITFKFKRFHQLTNIHIVKHGPDDARTADQQEPYVEIFIDRLWFSSCYFNRQIKNRLMICLSGIHMNYTHVRGSGSPGDLFFGGNKNSSSASSEDNIYVQYLFWIFYLFFKYLGSIHIQNLSAKLFNIFRASSTGGEEFSVDKSKYVSANIEYFKVELSEASRIGWHSSHSPSSDTHHHDEDANDDEVEENFTLLYEISKNKEVSALNGHKLLKVSMRNLQLKVLRLKTNEHRLDSTHHQILGEVAIRTSDLNILLNRLNSTRDRPVSFQGSLKALIDYVYCIQVYVDETSCQLYKYNSTKSYFNDDLSQFVEFLNNRRMSESKGAALVAMSIVSKLQIVEITNMEATCIVTNHHSHRNYSTNAAALSSSYKYSKRDRIKFDVLKLFTRKCNPEQANERACLGFILLRNLHYFKMNRYNYSLLNKLSISLTRTRPSAYSLIWSCENANLYLHLKLLNDLIRSRVFASNETESDQTSKSSIRRQLGQFFLDLAKNNESLLLRLKFRSSYLHLIETIKPGSLNTTSFYPKSSIHVYSIGSKLFRLKYHHVGPRQRTFDFAVQQFILFKSTKTGEVLLSSSKSSQFNKIKFTNNLFENNQEWNLNELFDSISASSSAPPRRSSNQMSNSSTSSNHRHYWGQLFNLNSLTLHYELKSVGSSFVNLTVNSMHVEYTPSFFPLINNFLVANTELIDKLVQSLPASGSVSNERPHVFVNIQSVHVYLFFERIIFLYLKLDEINYQSIQRSSNPRAKTQTTNNGFCLLINEINFLQLKIDECYLQNNELALAQAKACTFKNSDKRIASYDPAEYLNYFIIYNFLESSSSDYNLILLIKSFNLNSHLTNLEETWYLTIQDIMFTWSFQMHFIVLQTFMKPLSALGENVPRGLLKRSSSEKRFEFKVLLESDVLVNFLFDYSQDSSKQVKQPQAGGPTSSYFSSYFSNAEITSPSPYIQTVSIILIGVYFKSSSDAETAFKISDVSMYINVDDQNIYSVMTSNSAVHEDDEGTHQTHCQRQFFHATSIEWSHSGGQSEALVADRELVKAEQRTNRLTKVSFDLFHVNFIFKYDFAKLIDHILNLRKCFKFLNGRLGDQKSATPAELSSDLLLTIDKFKLTIEDDPFEVKLAYNYTLMVDEYHESVKRRKTLDQRRLIKEQHLEQQAFALLREHESKIYLQRSKMIYKSSNQPQQQGQTQQPKQRIRTELFTVLSERVHFFALADSTWHTRQQCYDMLRRIDADSPPPQPIARGQQNPESTNPADCYWILWCRYTNLLLHSIKFQFRDYTQPLMRIKEFHSFGHVVGSEYLPAPRSRRDVRLGIGAEFKDLSEAYSIGIQRNMSPFKFYHDLCCKIGFFSFAYGPNMEGSMAQLNLSLDKIIHPPRDPSRPMPWWDKSRLYLHGRLTASMDQAQIIYHVSMDPYNRTEEMKLVWSGLYFDWTNMKMVFKGVLDVYLNTESKYDDCRLLHLPNLELTIGIEWLCKAQNNPKLPSTTSVQANSHNYVHPCAPDKLPAIINSCEHDSFALFRSERANLSFSFVCTIDNDLTLKPNSKLTYPTLKFYASTSRFLQRIKGMLSAITRPTRRGRLFQNLKPRKPILSRHFKLVNFHLDIPKLNIIYWSSASEEFGLNLECENFRLNSAHSLELVPFQDNLKRRPRPCWSIDLMKCSFEEINIFLMSPMLNNEPSKLFNEETLELHADRSFKPGVRNFFMKIDSIFYEREKDAKNKPSPSGTAPSTSSRISTDSILTTNELMFSSSFNEKPVRLKKNRSLMMSAGGRSKGEGVSHSFRSPSSIWKYKRESALSSSSSSDAIKGMMTFAKAYQPSATSFLRSKFHTIARNTSLNEWLGQEERPRTYGLLMDNDKSESAGIRKLNEAVNSTSSFVNNRPNEMPKLLKTVSSNSSVQPAKSLPKHNIKITNLKAKWNTVNRDVIFTLYEIYSKAKRLRHNLSTEALKQFDIFLDDQVVNNFTAIRQSQQHLNSGFSRKPSVNTKPTASKQFTPFSQLPLFTKEPGDNSNTFFEELLNKLDSERNSKVYCDEGIQVEANSFNDLLYGVHAVTKMFDVLEENVYIEFINSQVKLSLENLDSSSSANKKSTDSTDVNSTPVKQNSQIFPSSSSGRESNEDEYLIISAAKAYVVQKIHKPVWKSQRLLDKTSWTGNLESMQYFATLSIGQRSQEEGQDNDSSSSSSRRPNKAANLRYITEDLLDQNNEYWLSDDIIDPSGRKSKSDEIESDGEETTFSSASSNTSSLNDLSQIAPDKNTLGMLIAYKNKESRISSPVFKDPKPNEPTGNKATRNLRRGLILLRRNNAAASQKNEPVQKCPSSVAQKYLQMIVSKCRCEFHIIDYDDKLLNIEEGEKVYLSNENTSSSNTYLTSRNLPNLNSLGQSDGLGPENSQIDLNASFNEPVDCFTLIHHDMNLCTNSQQYKMIMDVVNNLVLYFRPRRKEVIDKQKSIKFNLQLSMGNLDSLKQHIQLKQIETKELLCKLRALERRLYHSREKIENEIQAFDSKHGFRAFEMVQAVPNQGVDSSTITEFLQINELKLENAKMDNEYNACKKKLNLFSDELNIMISCYKELMLEKRAFTLANGGASTFGNPNRLSANQYLMNNGHYFTKYSNGEEQALNINRKIDLDQQAQESIINNEIGRRYEIWFKHIQWKLNDQDGQTGCARFLMKNFIYTKVAATPSQQELDCVEHNLEVESCKIQDLSAPNSRKTKKAAKKHSKRDKSPEMKSENYVLSSLFDTGVGSLQNLSNDADDLNDSSSTLPSAYLTNSNTMMFRIFCKERPPVGIPVIEHLELNLSPLVIKLTNRFYKMMIKFFFDQQQSKLGNQPPAVADSKSSKSSMNRPAMNSASSTLTSHYQRHSYRMSSANDEQINNMLQVSLNNAGQISATTPLSMSPCSATSIQNAQQAPESGKQPLTSSIIQSPILSKSLLQKKASQSSLFSVNVNSPNAVSAAHSNAVLLQLASADKGLNSANNNSSDQLQNEDIEIMKQRSANNNTFLCIKIPEIQLLVSYKGNKEKNIKDLTDVSLLFPLFEVHDKTWTWLDLINALKSHVKKALVSQAIKHKLIKVPIKPVNKLINRGRRSHSQQQLTNLEIEENEKMTILKLFGAKLIEKKSQSISATLPSNAKMDLDLDSSLLSSPKSNQRSILSPSNSLKAEKPLVPIKEEKKGAKKLEKSYSSLSFNLKKRFLKFSSRDSKSNMSSEITNDSNSNDLPSTSEMAE